MTPAARFSLAALLGLVLTALILALNEAAPELPTQAFVLIAWLVACALTYLAVCIDNYFTEQDNGTQN